MIKNIPETWVTRILATIVFLVFVAILTILVIKVPQDPILEASEGVFGAVEQPSWYIYDQFSGFKTKADPSKIDDFASPNGQNTIINDGDRISIRDFGYRLIGQASTTQDYVTSLHTFRRRDGENIMIRSVGQYVQYYDQANDLWESILSTSTPGSIYDFADYNINTDLRSYTYFGNGVDPFSRWSGNKVQIIGEGVTSTASTIQTAESPIDVGFPATGEIIYCGQKIAYSGITVNGFTVSSAHECEGDRSIVITVEQFHSLPRGNIYLVANNRLFIAGIPSTTQAIYFSKYGDALDYVGASLITESTADSAGIFNLGEGGGAVTGLALDEGAIYAMKRPIIYRLTLDGDGLYSIVPLKPFDGKSQTTGATTNQSIFTGGNGIFFITPDRQIMSLSRVPEVDYPQIIPISDSIKPTIEASVFEKATGIYFQGRAYISAQSEIGTLANDVIFIWNDRIRAWESPVVGFNPSVFTIYDDGFGEALYFGDSRIAQVYKVTPGAIDNELGVTANWRSKQYTFGEPHHLKELDNFFIEGYISDNTTLSISLLLDDQGVTQRYTTEFSGTEDTFMFSADEFNLFGFYPFGFERFGTADSNQLKKFRVYLNRDLRRVPFYNLQLEVASDGVGQEWEIINYGFRIRRSTQPERSNIYRQF